MSSPVLLPAGQSFFKCTFNWVMQSDLLGGWSESFYASVATLAAAKSLANNLLTFLTQIRGNQAYCPSIRITQLGAAFRTVDKSLTGLTAANSAPGNSDADDIRTKGLLRLVGSNGQYTQQWLGALPDNCYTLGGKWTPTPSFLSAFGLVIAALSGGPWYIKKVAQTTPYQKQTGVTVAGAGVFTCAAHGFATGQLVSMGRWPDGFGVNGIWPVTVLTSTTFTLQGWAIPATLPTPTKSSYAQLYAWQFLVITRNTILTASSLPTNTITRATAHEVGRPSGQYTGRRKRRVR